MALTAVQPGTADPQSDHSLASLVNIARLGVSLRLRLSSNRLKRRGKQTRRIVHLAAFGYTVLNIVMLGAARFAAPEAAAETTILLMSTMALGWVFGPVLIGGVDETVDPTRLALLPLREAERYVVQLAAALSGTGPLAATVGLFVGLTIGHAGVGISIVVVPIAAVTAVLLMVGSGRCLAAVLAIAQRSRAGRDLAVLFAALAGGVLFTMAQLARSVTDVRGSGFVEILQWLPFAWPARAINAARAGAELSAIGWLLAAAVTMVLAHVGWIRLSRFLLLNGERSAQGRRRSNRALLHGARGVFTGSLSRQWIYLLRSPNSRVGLVFGTVFGVAFALVQILQQGDGMEAAAAFGILLAMLANLGAATNVLGFDAGSMWIDVLAGGPSRADMCARQVIALPNLLLPTWISGVVVGVWTGQWVLVTLVAMLAVPVAVNVLTFGMITSTLSPAPLPDFDNPFGNRQSNEGRGSRIVIIGITGLVVVAVLSVPVFMLTFSFLDRSWMWFTPLLGLAYAVAVFLLAAQWSGRRLLGREPELIERLSPRALN